MASDLLTMRPGFSQVLETQAKDMPGLNDMFLRYKQLKKKIKSIPVPSEAAGGMGGPCAGAQKGLNPMALNDDRSSGWRGPWRS